jgi:hypothetical protein
MSYRAHTDATTLEACHGLDTNTFTGEDSNSTALAVEAVDALGATPSQGDPLDFLDAMQNADGGFGQFAGNPTDANSTGVVLQAIVASGEGPAAGRWSQTGGKTPVSALLALQVGCSGTVGDRGAFAFQPDQDGALSPDAFATAQAVPGIAETPLPIDSTDLAASLPAIDCATPTDAGDGSVTTTTSTTVAVLSAGTGSGATSATLPATGATGPGHGVGTLALVGVLLALAGAALIGAARRPARQM